MKSYPYWWDTLPGIWPASAGTSPGDDGSQYRATEPQNPAPGRCDVVVVGGGYTGLAAARRLAHAGASVVVLERGRLGSGASSRNAGQVLTGLKVDPRHLVSAHGEGRARELFDVSREAIAGLGRLIADDEIECEFEKTGHLQAAAKPRHFREFRAEQELLARVFNHPVRLVEAADQSTELGAQGYHGLLIDEQSCALNPAKYVRGLGAAAARAGARIVEDIRVSRARKAGHRWSIATTRGQIDAGEVLFATNGYTDESSPALQRRLIPIGSYIVVTEPLPATVALTLLPRRRMAFDSRHFLHYFRLTPDNRLLFGGRAEFSGPTLESAKRATAILQRALRATFPVLAKSTIDYTWSGHVAFTRDQLPHAGQLDGAYFAGGYSGHGIAMATHLGDQVARRIAGERFEHPLFDDHFPAIPLYHGRPWFLPLVGLYYRFRDLID